MTTKKETSASKTSSTTTNDAPDNTLSLTLSQSLRKKLESMAQEEGVSLNDLCEELLAEATVIRAFELAERRVHLRGGANTNSNPQSNNTNNRNGNRGHRRDRYNNRRGGMSSSRYQSIMDDKASFLEYVRNQERAQNR